jgi:S-adenosylmethionine:tRNA ribosyltransferase-isomerase
VELLVDRIEDDHTVLAMAGSSKPLRSGQLLRLEKDGDACRGLVLERTGDRVLVRFSRRVEHVLDRLGHVPLPPYIERPDVERDRERYQTVYARSPGAVAAPTAGLHFDQALMDGLRRLGVRCVFLTLHVGAGTFQPVRARDPQDHRMHAEWIRVPSDVCAAVAEAKRCGNRVVAVGTTSVRALETLALRGGDAPYEGYTDLFLYPGKKFKTVDALITNFHLPRSSLLMLICAFAGTENTLHAYRHAVRSRYRFYSYGDAMFVTPQPEAVAC